MVKIPTLNKLLRNSYSDENIKIYVDNDVDFENVS